MSSVDRWFFESSYAGQSDPTERMIDDRPRSRSLATALWKGALRERPPYIELHRSLGHYREKSPPRHGKSRDQQSFDKYQ
jgi:hypothetical protein